LSPGPPPPPPPPLSPNSPECPPRRPVDCEYCVSRAVCTRRYLSRSWYRTYYSSLSSRREDDGAQYGNPSLQSTVLYQPSSTPYQPSSRTVLYYLYQPQQYQPHRQYSTAVDHRWTAEGGRVALCCPNTSVLGASATSHGAARHGTPSLRTEPGEDEGQRYMR